MNGPKSITETCDAIKADMQADVERFEGAEFNGRNVSEWVGGMAAAVSALAGMVKQLDDQITAKQVTL